MGVGYEQGIDLKVWSSGQVHVIRDQVFPVPVHTGDQAHVQVVMYPAGGTRLQELIVVLVHAVEVGPEIEEHAVIFEAQMDLVPADAVRPIEHGDIYRHLPTLLGTAGGMINMSRYLSTTQRVRCRSLNEFRGIFISNVRESLMGISLDPKKSVVGILDNDFLITILIMLVRLSTEHSSNRTSGGI